MRSFIFYISKSHIFVSVRILLCLYCTVSSLFLQQNFYEISCLHRYLPSQNFEICQYTSRYIFEHLYQYSYSCKTFFVQYSINIFPHFLVSTYSGTSNSVSLSDTSRCRIVLSIFFCKQDVNRPVVLV